MPSWINAPHADYVLAAYTAAALALIGLAVSSWREQRKRAKEWAELSRTRTDDAS